MIKSRYWILSALALLIFSLVIFLPFQALAQFPPTVSYDWKVLTTPKTEKDCQKAALASVTKLFPERVQQRKSGTCGQGRGFAGCVVCITEKKVAVGLATGFDGVQTESIVKQLLSGI